MLLLELLLFAVVSVVGDVFLSAPSCLIQIFNSPSSYSGNPNLQQNTEEVFWSTQWLLFSVRN